jgi:signal transduction histidine kinase
MGFLAHTVSAVLVVNGARDAEIERRCRLLMAVLATFTVVLVSGMARVPWHRDTAYLWVLVFPIGMPTLVVAFLCARRGRASAAALLLGGYVLVLIATLIAIEGPSGYRMSVSVVAIVAVGAALDTRLIAVFGGVLVAIVAGLAAAQSAGIYVPRDPAFEPSYLPLIRQSLLLAALVVLLRRGYDRLVAQISKHEGARAVAVDAARAINTTLEDEVATRTASLLATRDRMSGLADRLATELGAGLGVVGGLLDEFMTAEAALGDAALRDVTRARAATRRLSAMLVRLREHALIGTAAVKRTRIDMNALVRQVVEDNAASSPDRAVDWQIGALPPAWADETLVHTIVENLISNALKFSQGRQPSRIAIRFDPSRGYTVQDNGIGFDSSRADALFAPFQRLHAGDEFEGHGVGLANVWRSLQRLGGEITAEAQPGTGATFAFQLPHPDGDAA